jgi:hypothetical protein
MRGSSPACSVAEFRHRAPCSQKRRFCVDLCAHFREYRGCQLAANIHGYDISPDMVRLSLVNLYLHCFTDPHIIEYDTLTEGV